MKINLSISACITEGWSLTKKYGLALACFVLVYLIVANLLSSVGTMSSDSFGVYMDAIQRQNYDRAMAALNEMSTGPVYYITSILTSIISIVFSIGMINTCLMLSSGKMPKVSFDGFKLSPMLYLKGVGLSFVIAICVLIGTFLCILPGIWVAIRLSMALYYLIDHPEAGIGESIKASWAMTKGNFWSLLGLDISNGFISLLGFCLCCIGYLFTMPWTIFNHASAYHTLVQNFIPEAEYETL